MDGIESVLGSKTFLDWDVYVCIAEFMTLDTWKSLDIE